MRKTLTMEKKRLLATAFITTLLFTIVVGTQLVTVGKANPNPTAPWGFHKGETNPSSSERPPEISITSPTNNTVWNERSLNLTLSVSVEKSNADTTRYINEVMYEADWLSQNKTVYKRAIPNEFQISQIINEFSNSINLTNIPEGNHNIVVYAIEKGWYKRGTGEMFGLHPVYYAYSFNLSSSSVVNFNVDTVAPEVSILQVQNKSFAESNVSLNFALNEPVSQAWYILDGEKNVTTAGNTTLSNLPYGKHNITVYATDNAGNTGASETIYFNIETPFPITSVATASGLSIATVGIGLLFYLKKRKR